MPIVFQQPSPVSPPISAAAGAAEQFTRFAPVLQRQQESLAQQYAQMNALGQRAASDQADRSQRGAEFGAQMDFRANAEVADQGKQQAEMQFRGQMQQAAQQAEAAHTEQRARLMQEAATAELTQREKVEMSRLQMAAGAVRDNPSLDPEEKNDLLTQIYTKIDPLQQRKARSALQQDKLENERLQQQIAQQDIIAKDRAAFMAGNLQAVTKDVTDAEGNYVGTFTMIPGEKAHFIDKKAQQAASQEKQQMAQQQLEHKQAEATQKHAERRAEFESKAYERAAAAFDKWAEMNKDNPDKQAAIRARAGNINEEVDALMARYDKSNPPPRRPGEATPNVGSSEGPQPDPAQKPFKPDDPDTQTVEQRAVVSGTKAALAAIRGVDIPREQLEKVWGGAEKALDLLAEHGSEVALKRKDPLAYAKYNAAMVELDKALTLAKQRRTPAPAEKKPASRILGLGAIGGTSRREPF